MESNLSRWETGRARRSEDTLDDDTLKAIGQLQQEYFNSRFTYDPRRETAWKEVARYLQELYIPVDSRVLDLGAGYCDFINRIEARERYALDLFARLEEYAAADVVCRVGPCTDLSAFGDGAIDVIFASNLFEHLSRDDLLRTLVEIKRVLRPAGRLILLQPNFRYCYRTYFDDYTHLQVFTDEGLKDLLHAIGMRVTVMRKRFLPVNMKSTLRRNLPFLGALVYLYLRSPFKPRAAQMLAVAENTPPVMPRGAA